MKKMLKGTLATLLVMGSMSVGTVKAADNATRVETLLGKMSIEEKVGQMIQADIRSIKPEDVANYKIGSILSGGGAAPKSGNKLENWAENADKYQKAAIDGFGIPLLYGIDAVHGNNNVYGATIYPHNIGLAAANNANLVEKIGEATTSEVKAIGTNWTFTPTLGLPHNERWGRTYETFGDSLDRINNLGSAYIRGIQNNNSVLATAKHFIGEGITTNGTNQGNVVMSEADYEALLGEDMNNPIVKELLTPYIQAIKEGAKSVMVSYNSINDIKCHGNADLINDLLKNKLGFKGIVISDYNGIDQIEGDLSYEEKATKAVNAGLDMLMVDGESGGKANWLRLYEGLVNSVKNNKIAISRIDDAVTRILMAKFELGIMDDFSKAFASQTDQALFGGQEHRTIARQAVSESLVLLKNDEYNGKTIMKALPSFKNVLVAGKAADDIGTQCGGWTISWQGSAGNITKGTTIFSGIKEAVNAKGNKAFYAGNGFMENDSIDVAVIAVGEAPYAESNGDRSASQLKLSTEDINTINTVKSDHPDIPIVLLLVTGRPLNMSEYVNDPQIKGIVNAWLPGSEGAGVADVLYGDKDFVGTNPITWTWYPQDIENKNDESKVLYKVGYGLKKNDVTPSFTTPNNPMVVDLGQTNGKLEVEAYTDIDSNIQFENNGTTAGYLDNGRYITYKINVPKKAAYELTVRAAREYGETINGAFELYLDGTKVLSKEDTTIVSTHSWTNFTDQVMDAYVSLDSGLHELKFVACAKDFNIDYFQFAEKGDYVKPDEEEKSDNIGTGSLLKEDAVSVTMSSSENSGSMSWYTGNQRISDKNSAKDSLDIRSKDDSSITTININTSQTFQTLLGMGTSIEESTVHNLMKMSDENRKAFLKRLVDPVNGCGMTLFRLTIGTADFTAQPFYTYYDNKPDGEIDWNNETGKGFSIQKDRDYHIIQVIHELQEVAKECHVEDQIKFFASPWTPPGWMKEETAFSKKVANNDLLLMGGKLSDNHINDAAKYYVRYIEEYAKEGIPIYAMTLQNEPMLEIEYPSCLVTPEQEAKLATAIKEELKDSTVLSKQAKELKVWAFDHNPGDLNSYMGTAYEAGNDIDGAAVHDYGGELSNMTSLHNTYPDKGIYLTERSVWGTSGMDRIMQYLRNYCESYNGWVTMLDSKISTHQWTGTPDPTMFVQDSNVPDNYWATPEVYLLSQFTKYLRPGFVRVSSTYGTSSTVTNVVFKDTENNKLYMVVANQTDKEQAFKTVVGSTQFNATLPAGRVATYSWSEDDNIVEALNVPGTFKASDCIAYQNLQVNGDNTLGNLTDGASADYMVNVKEAGTYNVKINVATAAEDRKTIKLKSGETVLGSTTLDKFDTWSGDGAWGNYKPIQIQVKLEKGIQVLTLSVPTGSVNIGDITFEKTKDIHQLPGYIKANDFCESDGVIVENNEVGFFETASDWSKQDMLVYRVNAQKTGQYSMKLEYSTGDKDGNYFVEIKHENDEKYTGDPVSSGHILKKTAGYDKYQKSDGVELSLTEGENLIKIIPNGDNGFNLKSLSFGPYIIASSDELEEGKLDGKVISVELHDGQFVDTLDASQWKINNLPEGITYDIKRNNETKVQMTLKGIEKVDYDNDLSIEINIDASQINDQDYKLTDELSIKAIDDEETLSHIDDIVFGNKAFMVSINGGQFKRQLTADDIVLSENIAKYVSIENIEVNDEGTRLSVGLKRNAVNYDDILGTITIKPTGYTDGNESLETSLQLLKTNDLPESIQFNGNELSLNEKQAYRNNGSLSSEVVKGNYVDYYLNIEEAGQYIISYDIWNNDSISNALKISGGEGLKTDNLASVSFSKFFGNTLKYRQMINLQKGEQTLRFEVNNSGFTLNNLNITKLDASVEINDKTTVSVDNLIDGSKNYGWGIETKNNISNIGCGVTGSYQDYYIDVKKSGIYDLSLDYSQSCNGDSKAIIIDMNSRSNATLGEIVLKNTTSWDTFKTSDKASIRLTAGEHIIRIYDDWDGFNYRSFTLELTKEQDFIAPVISGENATVYAGDNVDLMQAFNLKAEDNLEGDITSKVVLSGDYDLNKAGTYTVKATVQDSDENTSEAEFKLVVVNKAVLEYNNEKVAVGDTFDPLKDVVAKDNDGTDITDHLVVISNQVDTTKPGTYAIVYQVVDSLGNTISFTRNVEVVEKDDSNSNLPDDSDNPIIPPSDDDKENTIVPPAGDDKETPNITPSDNNNNNTVIEGEVVTPTTSDNINILPFVFMFGVSSLAVLYILKKKKA